MPSPSTMTVIVHTFFAWTALSIVFGAIVGTVMYRYDKRNTRTPPFPWEGK